MNGKEAKKIRQLYNRNRRKLEKVVVEDFFDMVRELKFKYRVKLAFFVLIRKDIRKMYANKKESKNAD